ncbi:hypothetical protein KY289_009870 [Solanum tuberosum]|nr:hypothetical protein KY289_009870 [Solanum tuberosum]
MTKFKRVKRKARYLDSKYMKDISNTTGDVRDLPKDGAQLRNLADEEQHDHINAENSGQATMKGTDNEGIQQLSVVLHMQQ